MILIDIISERVKRLETTRLTSLTAGAVGQSEIARVHGADNIKQTNRSVSSDSTPITDPLHGQLVYMQTHRFALR